ncbi:disulfide bond formation protein B [Pokkaliibacter sp. CJK22405]|uniref:disulfide bond formation protein B n=1 Tax=Pokkaliibacter sp. CJK22405 TaxID=3384615 RepID=UPI0039852AB8
MSNRVVNGVVALGCIILLAIAFYIEYGMGMEPCPLCLMQRIVFGVVGLVCLAAFIHNPQSRGLKVYGGLTLLVALMGIGLAGRQLWLQSLPADQVPACGPGIYFMLERFPFSKTLETMIMGSGDCAEVQKFWGLSIPLWSLFGFIGCALAGIFGIFRTQSSK